MRFAGFIFALLAACSAPMALPLAPPPPPTTTQAVLPIYALEGNPALRVELHAPHASAYRPTIVGSRPETVELTIGSAGPSAIDLGSAALSFDVRRGPVSIPCPVRDDVPKREPRRLLPGQKVVLARDLCSLPLPGDYVVDAFLAVEGREPEHVGSFPFTVKARGPNVPRAVEGTPGLFAAMGGDPTGMRFTRVEWASGAYHVIVRLTNAGTVPVALHPAQVVFRVTRAGQPLACTSSHAVAPPDQLAPGASWLAAVPVTCLIDVKGRYEIHAALDMDEHETPLLELPVEVTGNPLLYLPIIPW